MPYVYNIFFFIMQVCYNFQFSFFQTKRVNHCEGYVNFQDIEYQIQKKIYIVVIIIAFC